MSAGGHFEEFQMTYLCNASSDLLCVCTATLYFALGHCVTVDAMTGWRWETFRIMDGSQPT